MAVGHGLHDAYDKGSGGVLLRAKVGPKAGAQH